MTEKPARILLALDGSEQSLDVVRYASDFFPARQTEMVLYHVETAVPEPLLDVEHPPAQLPASIPVQAWTLHARKRVEACMQEAQEILARAGFRPDRIVAKLRRRRVGVARDLLREARRGYGAVIVGRSGVSGVDGVVVGSVAHKLVTTIHPVPIAVVGGRPESRRVLVGFDGSPGAVQAVDLVCAMMPHPERDVMLCYMVRSLGIHAGQEAVFTPEDENGWLRSAGLQIEPGFPDAEKRLVDAGFHPSHVYIRVLEKVVSRAAQIHHAARSGGFGTIVLGRRGRSAVHEFPMGRVTRKVLQLADRMAVWVV